MNLSQIFDKLVSIGAKATNLKSQSKSKVFSKDEKEFIANNFDKIATKLQAKSNTDFIVNQFNRDKVVADSLKLSVKRFRELQQKSNAICECFNAGYSMGGTIELVVKHGDKLVKMGRYSNTQEYAQSSNYRAIHGYNDINLSLKELEQIVIIGGIPTIKLSKDKIAECIVLVGSGHKHKYFIKRVDMFVTSDFHGICYDSCVNWRKNIVATKLKQRNKNSIRITSLKRFVGFNHSLAVGNCKEGTKMFAQKYGLNEEYGYSLDYLIQLEPNNQYLNRLVTNL